MEFRDSRRRLCRERPPWRSVPSRETLSQAPERHGGRSLQKRSLLSWNRERPFSLRVRRFRWHAWTPRRGVAYQPRAERIAALGGGKSETVSPEGAKHRNHIGPMRFGPFLS